MDSAGAVIPAFPYEGAFLWFLGDENTRKFASNYYQTLYGPHGDNIPVRAAALACLFPEIIMAPADAKLPDGPTFTANSAYRHPDLRISMNWREHEWSEVNVEIAKIAGADPAVRSAVAALPHLSGNADRQHHFLCRVVLQNRLAGSTGATLIGNAAFQQISALVAPWIGSVAGDAAVRRGVKLPLSENTLDVVGLNFAPGTLDSFAAIRSSTAVSQYAASFRDILASQASAVDLEHSLLTLMQEAMESSEIAGRVASGFSTAGSALGVLGLIPLVGTATSIMSLGTDASSRVADKVAEKKSWYLIGAKMQEVATRDLLKRRTESS